MRKSVERQKRTKAISEAIRAAHISTRRRNVTVLILGLVILDVLIIGTFQLLANLQTTHTQATQQMAPAKDTTFATILTATDQAEAHIAEKTVKSIPQYPQTSTSTATSATAHCDVTNPTSITVVVNKKHCIDPPSWAPSDLTTVDGFLMRTIAADHMQQMIQAATAAGVPFGLTSGYRSYDDQVATYNNWVQVNGSTSSADSVSARPGYSEHQTGLAADLKINSCVLECFGTTAQYTWLKQNAATYGFIERYPSGLTAITGYSPEPWHWRYVGSDVAESMKQAGVQTLEEYLGISGGDYN